MRQKTMKQDDPANQHAGAYDHYVTSRSAIAPGTDESALATFAARYARYLKGWLPEDRSAAIFDAGCGHGNMLFALSAWGYTNLHGVDLSAQQVTLARQRFPQVEQGDVLAYLEERSASFDVITALDLLEHFTYDQAGKFLSFAREALKPGGRIILQTPNGAAPRCGTYLWGDATHQRAYAPSAVRQLLALHGFCTIEFRETPPVAHGPVSLMRCVLWQVLRCAAIFWDLVEVGKVQPVYTRNMVTIAYPDEIPCE